MSGYKTFEEMNQMDYKQMNISQLKALCKSAGIKCTDGGREHKDVMVSRLTDYSNLLRRARGMDNSVEATAGMMSFFRVSALQNILSAFDPTAKKGKAKAGLVESVLGLFGSREATEEYGATRLVSGMQSKEYLSRPARPTSRLMYDYNEDDLKAVKLENVKQEEDELFPEDNEQPYIPPRRVKKEPDDGIYPEQQEVNLGGWVIPGAAASSSSDYPRRAPPVVASSSSLVGMYDPQPMPQPVPQPNLVERSLAGRDAKGMGFGPSLVKQPRKKKAKKVPMASVAPPGPVVRASLAQTVEEVAKRVIRPSILNVMDAPVAAFSRPKQVNVEAKGQPVPAGGVVDVDSDAPTEIDDSEATLSVAMEERPPPQAPKRKRQPKQAPKPKPSQKEFWYVDANDEYDLFMRMEKLMPLGPSEYKRGLRAALKEWIEAVVSTILHDATIETQKDQVDALAEDTVSFENEAYHGLLIPLSMLLIVFNYIYDQSFTPSEYDSMVNRGEEPEEYKAIELILSTIANNQRKRNGLQSHSMGANLGRKYYNLPDAPLSAQDVLKMQFVKQFGHDPTYDELQAFRKERTANLLKKHVTQDRQIVDVEEMDDDDDDEPSNDDEDVPNEDDLAFIENDLPDAQ